MPQFKYARAQELRSILADIKSADQSRLSELCVLHIGYDYFADDPMATVGSVREDLSDFIAEVGAAESILWCDISDDE